MSNWLEQLERKRLFFHIRFGASLLAFIIFVGLTIFFRETIAESRDQMMVALVALVVAMLILPRRALPSRWPTSEDPDKSYRIEKLRSSLRTVETSAIFLRIGYLLLTILLLVLVVF